MTTSDGELSTDPPAQCGLAPSGQASMWHGRDEDQGAESTLALVSTLQRGTKARARRP